MTATRHNRGRQAERRGRFAENLAALLLRCKGYRILARRLRTRAGEIDLVAKSLAGTICFVEVKTRSDETAAVAAVSARQRRRIEKAAALYLLGRDAGRAVRFDVISIVPGRLPRHIRDAWRAET